MLAFKSAATTALLVLVLWLVLAIATACNAQDQTSREPTVTERQLVESGNSFGFKLFQQVVEGQDPNSNAIISPLSVSLALAMTCNGARDQTEEAMTRALELLGIPMGQVNESYRSLVSDLKTADAEVLFEAAQSIWCRDDFEVEDGFLETNRTYFDAEVAELDFRDPGSVKKINDWVNSKTNGKIDRILSEIPLDAVMYLLNAIYFKGIWSDQFDPENTRDEPFHLLDGSDVMCQMMRMKESRHEYYVDGENGFAAVDLPYGDGRFSMTILLPDEGRHVDSLAVALDSENWGSWTDRLRPTDVILLMPKFRLEYGVNLNDALTALGMGVAFAPLRADFRGINREKGDSLYISRVIHKTFVEVNEEGTEAAAATVVEMARVTSAGPSTKIVFKVDRPFLFAIRDRQTGTVLFLGKVTDPSA